MPLSQVLDLAGLKPGARYVIFHCADNLGETADDTGLYYESIDLLDAYHPQTILAYGMNGKDLPVAHGAPLRLRVERQLGYKQAKYIDAHRGRRRLRAPQRRQGRLLGRPRLRVVRGDLTASPLILARAAYA